MPVVLAPAPQDRVHPLAASPAFSIVIAAYQAAETIGDAVRSALVQVRPAREVIVVDDGSTDDLEAALREFRGRITLITKENGGGASALNAGAAAASAEFLAILDADDAYHPRRIEALETLATERSDLDLITTDARFVQGGAAAGRFYDYNTFAVDDQRTAILQSCFVGGWPAVRLSRLHAIGGFDEALRTGYDWDCWLRLIHAGSRAGLVNEPYYDYRLHSGSLTASRRSSLWDRVRLLEKARQDPGLSPDELQALGRSLRDHRTRAVLTEIQADRRDRAPRRRLLGFALSSGVGVRARLAALVAATAPALSGSIVPRETPPEDRFRAATG